MLLKILTAAGAALLISGTALAQDVSNNSTEKFESCDAKGVISVAARKKTNAKGTGCYANFTAAYNAAENAYYTMAKACAAVGGELDGFVKPEYAADKSCPIIKVAGANIMITKITETQICTCKKEDDGEGEPEGEKEDAKELSKE